MLSVGEQLASARQSKDWSMEDVARSSYARIRFWPLRKDAQVFSAPVYVRGSVKSYAKLVRLTRPSW